VSILEQALRARNNPSVVKFFPDGTLAWPGVPAPRFELRGGAVAEPPAIDIGADILNIERRAAEPARITLCRQAPTDAGYREIFVSIDGEQVAVLQYGDTYTCEIKPGPHRLRAHNTLFWKTHQIVLRPAEHAKFTAINRTGTISFGLLFMLGAFPVYLTFERDIEKVQDPRSKIQIPNQSSR
jgi:hypothetical protein